MPRRDNRLARKGVATEGRRSPWKGNDLHYTGTGSPLGLATLLGGEDHVQSSIPVLVAEPRGAGTGGDHHVRVLRCTRGGARRVRLLELLPFAAGWNAIAAGRGSTASGAAGGPPATDDCFDAGDASGQALSVQRPGDTDRCHQRVGHQHDDREGSLRGRVRRPGLER